MQPKRVVHGRPDQVRPSSTFLSPSSTSPQTDSIDALGARSHIRATIQAARAAVAESRKASGIDSKYLTHSHTQHPTHDRSMPTPTLSLPKSTLPSLVIHGSLAPLPPLDTLSNRGPAPPSSHPIPPSTGTTVSSRLSRPHSSPSGPPPSTPPMYDINESVEYDSEAGISFFDSSNSSLLSQSSSTSSLFHSVASSSPEDASSSTSSSSLTSTPPIPSLAKPSRPFTPRLPRSSVPVRASRIRLVRKSSSSSSSSSPSSSPSTSQLDSASTSVTDDVPPQASSSSSPIASQSPLTESPPSPSSSLTQSGIVTPSDSSTLPSSRTWKRPESAKGRIRPTPPPRPTSASASPPPSAPDNSHAISPSTPSSSTSDTPSNSLSPTNTSTLAASLAVSSSTSSTTTSVSSPSPSPSPSPSSASPVLVNRMPTARKPLPLRGVTDPTILSPPPPPLHPAVTHFRAVVSTILPYSTPSSSTSSPLSPTAPTPLLLRPPPSRAGLGRIPTTRSHSLSLSASPLTSSSLPLVQHIRLPGSTAASHPPPFNPIFPQQTAPTTSTSSASSTSSTSSTSSPSDMPLSAVLRLVRSLSSLLTELDSILSTSTGHTQTSSSTTQGTLSARLTTHTPSVSSPSTSSSSPASLSSSSLGVPQPLTPAGALTSCLPARDLVWFCSLVFRIITAASAALTQTKDKSITSSPSSPSSSCPLFDLPLDEFVLRAWDSSSSSSPSSTSSEPDEQGNVCITVSDASYLAASVLLPLTAVQALDPITATTIPHVAATISALLQLSHISYSQPSNTFSPPTLTTALSLCEACTALTQVIHNVSLSPSHRPASATTSVSKALASLLDPFKWVTPDQSSAILSFQSLTPSMLHLLPQPLRQLFNQTDSTPTPSPLLQTSYLPVPSPFSLLLTNNTDPIATESAVALLTSAMTTLRNIASLKHRVSAEKYATRRMEGNKQLESKESGQRQSVGGQSAGGREERVVTTIIPFTTTGLLVRLVSWLALSSASHLSSLLTRLSTITNNSPSNTSDYVKGTNIDLCLPQIPECIGFQASRVIVKLSEVSEYIPILSTDRTLIRSGLTLLVASSLTSSSSSPSSASSLLLSSPFSVSSPFLVRLLYLFGNLTLNASPLPISYPAESPSISSSPLLRSCASLIATESLLPLALPTPASLDPSLPSSSSSSLVGIIAPINALHHYIYLFHNLLKNKSSASSSTSSPSPSSAPPTSVKPPPSSGLHTGLRRIASSRSRPGSAGRPSSAGNTATGSSSLVSTQSPAHPNTTNLGLFSLTGNSNVDGTMIDEDPLTECASVLVKLLRFVANLALDVEVGSSLVTITTLGKSLFSLLASLTTSLDTFPELLLNTAACITNLSFYSPQQMRHQDSGSPSSTSSCPLLLVHLPPQDILTPFFALISTLITRIIHRSPTIPSLEPPRDQNQPSFEEELLCECIRSLGNASRDQRVCVLIRSESHAYVLPSSPSSATTPVSPFSLLLQVLRLPALSSPSTNHSLSQLTCTHAACGVLINLCTADGSSTVNDNDAIHQLTIRSNNELLTVLGSLLSDRSHSIASELANIPPITSSSPSSSSSSSEQGGSLLRFNPSSMEQTASETLSLSVDIIDLIAKTCFNLACPLESSSPSSSSTSASTSSHPSSKMIHTPLHSIPSPLRAATMSTLRAAATALVAVADHCGIVLDAAVKAEDAQQIQNTSPSVSGTINPTSTTATTTTIIIINENKDMTANGLLRLADTIASLESRALDAATICVQTAISLKKNVAPYDIDIDTNGLYDFVDKDDDGDDSYSNDDPAGNKYVGVDRGEDEGEGEGEEELSHDTGYVPDALSGDEYEELLPEDQDGDRTPSPDQTLVIKEYYVDEADD